MVIFASPNQYFFYFSQRNSSWKKKEGTIYLNFQDSVKYWYFPENTGKKSKTTYFILLIKSVGMNTVVHLVSNMTFNHLSLIFTSFGYPVMHWAFT